MECGNTNEEGYLQSVIDAFAGVEVTEYVFTYDGNTLKDTVYNKGLSSYKLMVMPNVMHYVDVDAFKNDFYVCAVGAKYYPRSVNKDWLVMQSSCAGAIVEIEEGQVVGCAEIERAINFDVIVK